MKKRLSSARLALAVVSTLAEEMAIFAVWRWLLPRWGVNWPGGALAGVMGGWLIISIGTYVITSIILKKQNTGDTLSLVGIKGEAATSLAPEGMVKIKGELWNATAVEGAVNEGEEVVVVGQAGLKLTVRKTG
jgi:membrane-bound ClpP family serine protease